MIKSLIIVPFIVIGDVPETPSILLRVVFVSVKSTIPFISSIGVSKPSILQEFPNRYKEPFTFMSSNASSGGNGGCPKGTGTIFAVRFINNLAGPFAFVIITKPSFTSFRSSLLFIISSISFVSALGDEILKFKFLFILTFPSIFNGFVFI